MNLVQLAIQKNIPISKEQNYILALSGGIDSMVLAHAMLELKIPFAVAHCNYRLRGIESDGDEEFIRNFCSSNNLKLFLKIHPIDKENSSNIQEKAREIRHEYFQFLIKTHHYSNVILAHHIEDRIESFFLNLIRGSGLKGLSTMPTYSHKLLRPLLNLKKTDLLEYAEKYGIQWREDKSNLESKYSRNYIRNEVIPLFNNLNTAFVENAKKALYHLEFAEKLLKLYREIWEENHINYTKQGIEITICHSLEDYYLFEYLSERGFHYNTIEKIKNSLTITGNSFESHHQWKAFIDRGKLILTKGNFELTPNTELQIHENEIILYLNDSFLKFHKFEFNDRIINFKYNLDNLASCDVAKLSFPLTIRLWKPGDSMAPLGMNGKTKKIQDILTDRKVSRIEKNKTYVVLSDENIIWLVNHCISERVKITNQTKFIFNMEFTNLNS